MDPVEWAVLAAPAVSAAMPGVLVRVVSPEWAEQVVLVERPVSAAPLEPLAPVDLEDRAELAESAESAVQEVPVGPVGPVALEVREAEVASQAQAVRRVL